MSDPRPQPTSTIACPSCAQVQAADRGECSRCGRPLASPKQIYRREPDGSWMPLPEIDLSGLAPKTLPTPGRLNRRKALQIGLLLALPGAALAAASWWIHIRTTRQESTAVAQYLANPVGKIVPQFRVSYRRNTAGELHVAGETNLPDGTVMDVSVYAGQILAAVDFPVVVRGGGFRTRPLLQRGKEFSAGSYRVRIQSAFERRSQPASVLLVVGPWGERLQGAFVARNAGSGAAKIEFSEDFSLNP